MFAIVNMTLSSISSVGSASVAVGYNVDGEPHPSVCVPWEERLASAAVT